MNYAIKILKVCFNIGPPPFPLVKKGGGLCQLMIFFSLVPNVLVGNVSKNYKYK